jgi:hypothetical protein
VDVLHHLPGARPLFRCDAGADRVKVVVAQPIADATAISPPHLPV